MSCHKLPNYLRTYRKRAGLSQTDIAFLLGRKDAARVSRYEQFRQQPSLRTALALQVIFQAGTHELFGGEYRKVEKAVCRRAERLSAQLSADHADQVTVSKLNFLRQISLAAFERA